MQPWTVSTLMSHLSCWPSFWFGAAAEQQVVWAQLAPVALEAHATSCQMRISSQHLQLAVLQDLQSTACAAEQPASCAACARQMDHCISGMRMHALRLHLSAEPAKADLPLGLVDVLLVQGLGSTCPACCLRWGCAHLLGLQARSHARTTAADACHTQDLLVVGGQQRLQLQLDKPADSSS